MLQKSAAPRNNGLHGDDGIWGHCAWGRGLSVHAAQHGGPHLTFCFADCLTHAKVVPLLVCPLMSGVTCPILLRLPPWGGLLFITERGEEERTALPLELPYCIIVLIIYLLLT